MTFDMFNSYINCIKGYGFCQTKKGKFFNFPNSKIFMYIKGFEALQELCSTHILLYHRSFEMQNEGAAPPRIQL